MNCEQVQGLLVAYLDGEVTPSERALMVAHLSGCTVCQQELDLLSTARSRVRSALQHRASQAVPSPAAWSRLEAKLTETAQPSSSKFVTWFSRKVPRVDRASNQPFGGVTMQKRWIFSGLVGVIALSILAILVAQTATPVSARQILDRAYQAQSTQNQDEGIHHTRVETYQNICARPEDQGVSTIIDSYSDFQAGYFRTVITAAETGDVLEVFAFDGSHVYSGHRLSKGESVRGQVNNVQEGSEPLSRDSSFLCNQPFEYEADSLLTVYRGSQNNVAGVAVKVPANNEESQTHEEIFQKMLDDPNAELLGEETWIDGRKVYVLRSWQPVKALPEGSKELPMGWVMSYFDVESYRLVESRAAIERDGKEILVHYYRVLEDEILPVSSFQAWDLSDLAGIKIVDDPEGQHVDLLPEVISEEELAARSPSAYLLNNIPEGFRLEISASPKQPADQPFFYIASYRNEAGDYFVIQSIGKKEPKLVPEGATDTYTTAGGLQLHFIHGVMLPANKLDPVGSGVVSSRDDLPKQEVTVVSPNQGTVMQSEKAGPSIEELISAIVQAPDGTAFMINSNLPREMIEALAEELVPVK